MKLLFITTDNSHIAGPKRGEKSRIGFKASLFCVKIDLLIKSSVSLSVESGVFRVLCHANWQEALFFNSILACGHEQVSSDDSHCGYCLGDYQRNEEWFQCAICNVWFHNDYFYNCLKTNMFWIISKVSTVFQHLLR